MKKNNLVLFILVSLFSLQIAAPELINAGAESPFASYDPLVSMDFQDANLKDILKIFSIQSGLNFIASENVQDRKVTIYLDGVPIEQAMDKLFKANNLAYELDRTSNIIIVKDLGKFQIETVTRVFYLKYATVSSSSLKQEKSANLGATAAESSDSGITNAVKKLISQDGSVIEDSRTNSLIVTDIPSRMLIIAQTIAALDVPVPEVLIEVEILDVSKNAVDRVGIKFGTTPLTLNTVLAGSAVTSKFPWGRLFNDHRGTVTEGSFGVSTGSNSSAVSSYTVLLDFLKTQTDTKYLARPRILTLNNEVAEIKITTQESIAVDATVVAPSTGGTTTTTAAERTETGVLLRVTPQINLETSDITMFIYPQVIDTVAGSTLTSGGSSYAYRDPEIRSTKSTVRIKDGETVVIGGLLRNEVSETITKLPILGDIPLLGKLFTHKYKDRDRERELLIFITPHIVKGASFELAQVKKNTLPNREQDTFLGNTRRYAIIDSQLDRFQKDK